MPTASPSRPDHWARAALAGLILLFLLRILAILASPLELYADEAQYWRWAQTLEWGYYSKPPLIAWVIHMTTALFGDGPWAIRIAAPVLHLAAAVLLFLTGRAILDSRAGFFAAFLYALMPGVVLSSAVLSTDGVLMPVWCAALYLYWQLRAGKGGWGHALALGAAIGTGMLAKYAMLYFVIGVALTALIDPASRRFVISARGAAAGLVAALILAPHFAWNAANDFETVGHTVDNANLGGDLFNPENALSWFADQLGLFGPVSFLALLAGAWLFRGAKDEAARIDRWLMCFILPVLVFILAQAVVSRAHANWTATAYPAAALLVAIWFSRQMRGVLWTSLGLNGALAGVFMAGTALLSPAVTEALGVDNAMKRTRGWEASAAAVFAEAERLGATAVLVDEREAWHGLDYYGRDRDVPLISWRRYGGAKSFSERVPLEGAIAERVLVASVHADFRPYLRGDFETFEPVGQVRIDLGRRGNGCPITRVFQLYLATGHAPPERTPKWEAQFSGQTEFAEPRCPAPEEDAG
ncbi:ArnT family glycosyltransferase [Hyphomonas sp.]|uniref:ArnT family glycosyltransferase n=1 Tax=Hyphomonas sp. TaxID=87 RepID=UPI00391A5340